MSERVFILSAGAGESLVTRLRETSSAALGIEIVASFGAVGAMRDALLAGASCDLFLTSARVLEDLGEAGQLKVRTVRDVGWVQTGLAVRTGEPVPDVSTPTSVADALRAAPELFLPDPVRSTAGSHFSTVMEQVGIVAGNRDHVRIYPNGAAAMRALAVEGRPGAVGCTQVTEIVQTEGITLAGPLVPPYDLATLYQCALVDKATEPESARQILELLTGAPTAPLREELGLTPGESS